MRIIFNLLLIQTILSFSLQAQTITGNVKSNKGIAIAGATVSLLKAADSSIVKLQVSKEDGAFTFAIPDSVHYLITASSVGYSTAYFKLSQSGFPVVLLLQEAPAQMASVVVTAKKPLVQVKGDRTILNVEGTINATGNNVLELLRKSPSVTVNSEDRIGMNGKNSVQIFIDGKPTPLAGADLAAYLKSIQSSEVEAIELVTHPSAKYEAAGNAGIINIRLKKNKSLGTNGSLAAGYNQGVYGKYNSGLSFNHLTAKVNLFGGVTYNDATTQKKINMHRQQTDSAFYQTGTMKEASKTFNFKAGTDYFINTQNTVGLLVNGNFGNSVLANNSFTSISAVHANPSRLLKADNRFRSDRDHLDLNLNYLYAGKEGRTFSFNADYGYYNMTGVQFQPNAYYNGTGQTLLNTITYEMVTPTTIDIYSAKADYEQGFAKGKLGVGVKSSFVATDNDFQHYTFGQSGKSLDNDRSNRFIYKETIHAAYINYNRQWKAFQLQAGLRAENTTMNGTSTGRKEVISGLAGFDSTIRQNYLNLFPSIAVNYSKNPNHQFSLTASRRIDRPAYQDLNPFELKVDDYLLQRGNAYLRPQYTTGVGVGYVYRQKFNTSLNYSQVKDVSAWILDTTQSSKSVVAKQNIAAQKLLALNMSYPLQIGNYSVFTNLNGTYTTYNGEFGEGRTINQQAFGMNLFMQHSLKFAKTWTAEVTGFYYSPSLQEGNMRAEAFWAVDAGVQTKLLSDKATLKLSVSDLFNSLQFRSSSSFAGQTVNYNTKNETRQVKLSMGFRLGSNDIKSARQRKSGAEEEMRRVN